MVTGQIALPERYTWFTHDTSRDVLASIRKLGLVPQLVSGCPPEVLEYFGADGRRIVCLHPIGTKLWPKSSKTVEIVRLAVHRRHLPSPRSLDWSYVWQLAGVLKKDHPSWTPAEIVTQVIEQRGSIALYAPIEATHVRLWTKGLPYNDPSHWPALLDTTDESAAAVTNDCFT